MSDNGSNKGGIECHDLSDVQKESPKKSNPFSDDKFEDDDENDEGKAFHSRRNTNRGVDEHVTSKSDGGGNTGFKNNRGFSHLRMLN